MGENCSFKCCLDDNFNITLFHEILDIENLWGVEDTGIFRYWILKIFEGLRILEFLEGSTYHFHISLPFGGVTGSPRFATPLFSAVFKLFHFSKEAPSQAWLSELPRLLPAYPPCRPSASLHHLFLIPSLLIQCLPRILSLVLIPLR